MFNVGAHQWVRGVDRKLCSIVACKDCESSQCCCCWEEEVKQRKENPTTWGFPSLHAYYVEVGSPSILVGAG